MISKEFNGHILCYSSYKYDESKKLKEYISSNSFKSICNNLKEKTIIVLGGDGTMLRAIKHHYKLSLSFLGINFGNKGFLLNGKEYISMNSKFLEEKYPLMEAKVIVRDKIYSDIFINELNITAGGGKMLDLFIKLKNNSKINIKGDGILVCTPTGSTGYNSSLRGPIIPHSIPVLAITPKAPWLPIGQHPIILPDNEEIIINKVGRNSYVECYLDSRELYTGNDENIKIIVKKSSKQLSFLIEQNYKKVWDNKVLLEQGFE